MFHLYLRKILSSVASAVSGARLLQSGQIPSYVTNDDGTYKAGRDTDRLTLPENNPFGNLNRLNDDLGGSTYTSGVVLDWSTFDGTYVLGYYIGDAATNRDLTQGTLWATGLSIGGFTDWRLMNAPEMLNICDTSITSMLNYAPFNMTVAIGTSTSVSATSRNIVIPQNHQVSLNPSTTGYKTYATRDYTLADLGL